MTETNRQAARIKTVQPNNYCARDFNDVSMPEMKAFFGLRVTMEMLVYKDRYEQY